MMLFDPAGALITVSRAGLLPAALSEAARQQWTYAEFLERILGRELDAREGKLVRIAMQIAQSPCVRTIEEFDFSFQPSVDERLVRELETGNFIANCDNVCIFIHTGVGKTHLAIGLGRMIVEQGHAARFTTAMARLATLGKGESERSLARSSPSTRKRGS
jgi:DNA replication protein DnaC